MSYLLSFFFARNKGTQFQRENTTQNRTIQVRKQKREVDGGVYVSRVYESKRISSNKGKTAGEQHIQTGSQNAEPFTSDVPGFLQYI